MRLGFAVAIHVNPDVLLVDEVLAVGDEGFTHKCLDKFAEFRRRGKTILLVTHSLGLVERFCDEALWLDAGEVRAGGDPRRVVAAYITDVAKGEEKELAAGDARAQAEAAQGQAHEPKTPAAASEPPAAEPDQMPADMFKATEGRWGSREVEITAVDLVGDGGETGHVFQSGDPLSIQLTVVATDAVTDFVFGIGLFNADGVCVYGTNTDVEQFVPERIEGTGTVTFRIDRLDLVAGTYKLDVAVHARDNVPYDYHRSLHTFRVKSKLTDVGVYRPQHEWRFSPAVRLRPPVR
jgi:lipopolysaccharide transport system ATP-binding protein